MLRTRICRTPADRRVRRAARTSFNLRAQRGRQVRRPQQEHQVRKARAAQRRAREGRLQVGAAVPPAQRQLAVSRDRRSAEDDGPLPAAVEPVHPRLPSALRQAVQGGRLWLYEAVGFVRGDSACCAGICWEMFYFWGV